MMRYKQIEYRMGMVIEVIKCIPAGERTGQRQGSKKSKEEIRKCNELQAARKLARKIEANFGPGDMHVILTYRKEARPTPKEAAQILRDFFKKLREQYRKAGFQLKYICATEYKNKAIHHHLIVNNVNDGVHTTKDYIRRLWKGRGNPKYVDLYDDGDYGQLASYLIKETEKTFRDPDSVGKQRYSCSRNLVEPKPMIRHRRTKRGWQQEPKARPGYYVKKESLYNGFDKLGYPYQRYLMIKLDPEESDWQPGVWPEADEGGE